MIHRLHHRTVIALGHLLLAMGALAACGGGDDDDMPALGRYSYAVTFSQGFLADQTGALVLTYVSADSIAGRWEVPGLLRAAELGWRNGDAWVLAARLDPQTAYAINHRLAADGAGGLRCDRAVFIDPSSTYDAATCSVRGQ